MGLNILFQCDAHFKVHSSLVYTCNTQVNTNPQTSACEISILPCVVWIRPVYKIGHKVAAIRLQVMKTENNQADCLLSLVCYFMMCFLFINCFFVFNDQNNCSLTSYIQGVIYLLYVQLPAFIYQLLRNCHLCLSSSSNFSWISNCPMLLLLPICAVLSVFVIMILKMAVLSVNL